MDEKPVRRWAICQFYEPFIMGGNVWQWRQFQVDAFDVKLDAGFKGFAAHNPVAEKWVVYEAATGGLFGEGQTREEAIADANKNIAETPDLKKQVKELGDTSHFKEVSAEEAYRRIAKSK